MNLGHLYEFCTVRQLEVVQAIEKAGSIRGGAKALRLNYTSALQSLELAKKKAANRGVSPEHGWTHAVPEGHAIKRVSTAFAQDGSKPIQWVISEPDKQRQWELFQEAAKALAEDVKGLAPITPGPLNVASDLMCVIPFGDPHFGMYAWAKEAGDDFDTDIARDLTLSAVDRLLEVSPQSDVCVIIPLGDIFHANDQTNQTPMHKHQLDTDSRFVRVLQITVITFRHAIQRALEKHQRVIVRFVRGNHDPEAVWALAIATSAFFCNEPRVVIDLSPADQWYLRFGKVLIAATHGDRAKPDQLPSIMAADRPEDWGATKHRYWYTGHIHSSNKKEFPGVVWESFRTLAAKDAYAAGYGYRAGRDMVAIIHHRAHGEIERHRCDVGMIS